MENSIFGLLALLSLLAFIKRVKDAWFSKPTESKFEETRPPSFELPEHTDPLLRNAEQHKAFVWEGLIQLFYCWRLGVFEKQHYAETTFQISENTDALYHYLVLDQHLHFDVKILDSFPTELTTDLFILAAHFNNLLTFGKVIVDVNHNIVYFKYQNELSFYSVFPQKIEVDLSRHYQISKDVYWAFQKYVIEREEPVMIISELMEIQRMRQEEVGEN